MLNTLKNLMYIFRRIHLGLNFTSNGHTFLTSLQIHHNQIPMLLFKKNITMFILIAD